MHVTKAQILAIDREADVTNCAITEYGIDRSAADERFSLAQQSGPPCGTGTPVTTAPDAPAGPMRRDASPRRC